MAIWGAWGELGHANCPSVAARAILAGWRLYTPMSYEP